MIKKMKSDDFCFIIIITTDKNIGPIIPTLLLLNINNIKNFNYCLSKSL